MSEESESLKTDMQHLVLLSDLAFKQAARNSLVREQCPAPVFVPARKDSAGPTGFTSEDHPALLGSLRARDSGLFSRGRNANGDTYQAFGNFEAYLFAVA
jgi:hypothetical protein